MQPNFNYENLYQIWNQGFFLVPVNIQQKEVIHSIKIISDNKYDKIDFNNKKCKNF